MTNDAVSIKPIARIETDFSSKFGIPRQSGLVPELRAKIIFEPEFRIAEAVRGLEEFSHIWLIWRFSEAVRRDWSPTVRPPRLGGNRRVGVFATRSPFRPNSLALSCVRLEKVETTGSLGPVLHVSGADLMNGTPIFDIKPYIPYADCIPDAVGGFAASAPERRLHAEIPPEVAGKISEEKLEALIGVLESDPRPSYQDDPDRIYGFEFANMQIKFSVSGETVRVISINQQ